MSRAVGVAVVLAVASATTLNTYDQGASFTKCITITDWESKNLADEITLIDRDANGCCPELSVPGVEWYASYKGAQVVCGFKADGKVALSTSSSNGVKTCVYNNCYVDKQNLPCADGSKQLLNGCCAATTASNGGFPAQCKMYSYNFNNAYSESAEYCLTYDKDYGTKGYAGTTDKTDDQADGKLVTANIYTYTPCEGGGSGGGSGSSDPTTTTAAGNTAEGASIATAAVSGWLLSAAAAFAIRQ